MDDTLVEREDTRPTVPNPDDRRYRRTPVEIPGYVVAIPDPDLSDDYWDDIRPDSDLVTITDLSGFGLQFRGKAYFEEDAHVWVAMGLGGEMLPVRGVVVYRSDFRDDDGAEYFGVGVQFLKSDFARGAVSAIIDYLYPPAKSAGKPKADQMPAKIKSLWERLWRK